ncbi:nicotinate phosphoribosyltransferase [Quadrisphaera sp. KR29]|uniref:nicotinate phosphoribosyltransferase n=1 Tax=Quadrisphaera sp. KR29 TaxID=3461391 RepID=UPI004044477D
MTPPRSAAPTRTDLPSTALLTDAYELTMLESALRSGAAQRRCTFEVFARRLPDGRRYGVVAGTARVLDALERFRFDEPVLDALREAGRLSPETLEHLAAWRFTGDVDGYAEGEVYFPGSPVLTVTGTFEEAVVLETLVLAVLNHDSAVASAASRMAVAAGDRPIIEMGSRRTHEEAAVASARAAYLAGFSSTSNLEAGRRYGVPTSGTSAHAFTLLHDSEEAAFRAQVAALGTGTTLLVDTYDIRAGVETAVRVAGPQLGAVRIDSGDLAVLAVQVRQQLDALGATGTRIVLSGDLDEFGIAALGAAPVDAYGVGTSVVQGSGSPTAGMVYKLVEVEGRPVAKRSESKASHGGRKTAVRRHRSSGTATEEVVSAGGPPPAEPGDRALQVPLVRGGQRVGPASSGDGLAAAREHLGEVLVSLPWEGLALSKGDPAVPTRVLPPV